MPLGGALIASAAIGGGTSLLGGGKQASAARDAAQTQANATEYAANLASTASDKSLALQKDVYGTQLANAQPYLQTGTTALGQLSAGTAPGGAFTQTLNADNWKSLDPGYDITVSEGLKALERAGAATGNLASGGTLKGITNYAAGMAETGFGDAFNRFQAQQNQRFGQLSTLAGMGQTANNQATNAGSNYANGAGSTLTGTASNIGNLATSGANASAAGIVGAANANASSLSGIANAANQYAVMRALNGSGYGTTTTSYPGESTSEFE